MKEKSTEQYRREIRRLKLEIVTLQRYNERLETEKRILESTNDSLKDDIRACEDRIETLEK